MSEHRQGPVRSEAARMSILTATARLVLARGYDQLTMEGIAAEAGVGKQTIYRWWGGKSALVADALLEGLIFPERLIVPNTGDVRADMLSWLQSIFAILEQPGGDDLLRSLIAAAAENEDVGRRLHDSLAATDSLTDRLQAAVRAGQLSPDIPIIELAEAFLGALIVRALSREPGDLEASARLVDAVLGRRSPA